MSTVTITDLNEIRALHRVLYKRKFLDGPLDEFFGSPFIANVQRQLLEALREHDAPSAWDSWADASAHQNALDRVNEVVAGDDDWWGGLAQVDRERFVVDCLAPLDASGGLLASMTAVG